MANIIPVRSRPEMVERITPNFQRSTVMVPFPGQNGNHVVVEFTRNQYLRMISDMEEAWAQLRRRDTMDLQMNDIDKWEGLT